MFYDPQEDDAGDLGNKQFLVIMLLIFFGGIRLIDLMKISLEQHSRVVERERIMLTLQQKMMEQPLSTKPLELAVASQ